MCILARAEDILDFVVDADVGGGGGGVVVAVIASHINTSPCSTGQKIYA